MCTFLGLLVRTHYSSSEAGYTGDGIPQVQYTAMKWCRISLKTSHSKDCKEQASFSSSDSVSVFLLQFPYTFCYMFALTWAGQLCTCIITRLMYDIVGRAWVSACVEWGPVAWTWLSSECDWASGHKISHKKYTKGTVTSEVQFYRPIPLLPLISKTLECHVQFFFTGAP